MKFERKNLIMLLAVSLIIGVMNGAFGLSGLASLGTNCPGEACADARSITFMGLGIMAICLATAVWAGLKLRRDRGAR